MNGGHYSPTPQPELTYSDLIFLWGKTNWFKRKYIVILLWMDQHPERKAALVAIIALALILAGIWIYNISLVSPLAAVVIIFTIGVATGVIIGKIMR